MLTALIYLLVIGIVIGLIFWLVDYLPVPAPLDKGIKVAAIVIGVNVVIMVLLDLTGADVGFRPMTRP
jgi:hypothetical protein